MFNMKTQYKARDSDQEFAKQFFVDQDFDEMGEVMDQILNKVAKDPTIRRNLKKHQSAGVQENLNKFEIKSELTEEQNLSRI